MSAPELKPSPVQWKHPGAKEAAVAMVRTSIAGSNLMIALEASAVVLAVTSSILANDCEGVSGKVVANVALDEIFEQLGAPSSVQELLGRLSSP